MSDTVEKIGNFINSRVTGQPETARNMLAAAWSLVGFKAAHFPSKKRASSHEFLQAYTGKLLSKMLKDSSNAAVVNIFLPCEIFHAMDMKIMAPEALAFYVANTAAERRFLEIAEENGAPDTLCSVHKSLIGAAKSGVSTKPALIMNTTMACDANQLTFRELADHWNVPHYVIDTPYSVSEDAVDYVAEQLETLVPAIEESAHKKLDMSKLKAALENDRKTIENFKKYLSIRADRHMPESFTPELLNSCANHIYLGTPEALRYSELLLEDAGNAPALGDRKKILWMHAMPNWQESLKGVFQEDANVEVIACDLAFDGLVDIDPEEPFKSMARRIVYDTYNGAGNRRIDDTLARAKQTGAAGIVIFCQWGCRQTQGIALKAKRVFEEAGFPTLVLDGDCADRANGGGGQIVTRAKAFTELLEAGG